ncbi:MAG TPA: hypothetical protein VGA77_12505 [Propylenella sp.]
MLDFLRLLRREPGGHRDVFAEFAMVMIFLRAEHLAAKRGNARLRVVR